MLISLNVGLQYPKKTKRGNPLTLVGLSIGRATTVGKLAVTPVLLAGISVGRATTKGELATNTIKLAGAAVGRAATSAILTTPKLLAGIATGRATTIGKFPAATAHLLAGISTGRATTAAKLTMPRLLAGIAVGRATTVGKLPTTTTHLLAGIATGRATTVSVLTAGAATFSPTSIAGLQIWFDASQITGKVDGDVIPSWNDLSTFARHANQATAAKQPLYKTAIQNGKPVVRFDGVDDFLQTALTFDIVQPDTIIAVAFFRGPGEANGILYDAGSGVGGRQFVRRSVGQYSLYAGNAPLKEAALTSTPVWSVFTTTLSGSPGNVYLNGTLLISGNAGLSNSQGITLAANYVGTENSILDIAEFIVYNSELSTANRQAVQQYLGTKWGVAVV